MNKEELIRAVAWRVWDSEATVQRILNATLEIIMDTLSRGRDVNIKGFGKFEPKVRAPRTGRNPHTNTPVPIPRRIVPVFTPSQTMKTAVTKEVKK